MIKPTKAELKELEIEIARLLGCKDWVAAAELARALLILEELAKRES